MRKYKLFGFLAIFLVFCFGFLPFAIAGGDETTEKLLERIEELEKKVEVLNNRLSVYEKAPAVTVPDEVIQKKVDDILAKKPIIPAVELKEPTWPVAGIYTVADTKDLGQLTGIPWLSGTKMRGWIDTHYVYNFNAPDRGVVNTNQGSSVVKGRDVSIEGRTFDIHDSSFNLSLAELEIEKVPELGGVGYKFDMAFGETQDIIIDTIKGAVGTAAATDSVTDFDKTFQHASVSYLAPVGRGLRFDAGKFVTHIGGETIETIKNWNYSHSFFYTYAIPFQDTGIHLSYPWTDTFYTDFYVLNGWNVTIDNNSGKTFGPSIGWVASPWLSIYANYLTGPERTDNNHDIRHLFDTQIFLGPFDKWNFMVNFDHGLDQDAVSAGTEDAVWTGVTGYARYKWNDWLEPSLRVEYFNDRDGFTTNLDQELFGLTLTLNIKLGGGKGSGSVVMLRPELRYDRSNKNFFTKDDTFRDTDHQLTAGAGLSWFF